MGKGPVVENSPGLSMWTPPVEALIPRWLWGICVPGLPSIFLPFGLLVWSHRCGLWL